MKDKDLQEWEEYQLKQDTESLRLYVCGFILATLGVLILIMLS